MLLVYLLIKSLQECIKFGLISRKSINLVEKSHNWSGKIEKDRFVMKNKVVFEGLGRVYN